MAPRVTFGDLRDSMNSGDGSRHTSPLRRGCFKNRIFLFFRRRFLAKYTFWTSNLNTFSSFQIFESIFVYKLRRRHSHRRILTRVVAAKLWSGASHLGWRKKSLRFNFFVQIWHISHQNQPKCKNLLQKYWFCFRFGRESHDSDARPTFQPTDSKPTLKSSATTQF